MPVCHGLPLGTHNDKHSAPAPIQHSAPIPFKHSAHAPSQPSTCKLIKLRAHAPFKHSAHAPDCSTRACHKPTDHRVSGGIRAAVAQGTVASAKKILLDSLLRKTMANTKERIDALEAHIHDMLRSDHDAPGILKQFSLRLDALEVNLEATENARYAESIEWESKFQELQDRVEHNARHAEGIDWESKFQELQDRVELLSRAVVNTPAGGNPEENLSGEKPKDMPPKKKGDVPGKGLMYVDIKVNGKAIRAMVDTGATHNYISSTKVERLGLTLEKGCRRVKAINSAAQPVAGIARSVLIKLTSKQARWQELLAEFNFMLEYRASSTNNVADALSRRVELDQVALMAMNAIVRADSRVPINIGRKIRKALTRDPVAQQLLKLVESGKTRKFWQEDGLLMTKGRRDTKTQPKAAGKRVTESILNDRVITTSRKHHQEYLVKWQGYTDEENT
ncbi:hypothetical protein RJ640_003351 [Escallonia rubra]|uniref:Chromo domain-containing protein n=1 Tax=Escallonia rubra TaxID=112253 RepID=A0AA88UGP1_9ASTE|nr:hypothetical protein RJ640_003351 [Escallonia rubra]